MSETPEATTPEQSSANPSAPQMDPNPVNEVPQPPEQMTQEQLEIVGRIEDAMMDVIDPELGINVIDLGLVYDIWLEDKTAVINMTLTSPACPLTDMLEDETQSSVLGRVEEVEAVRLNWVWTPAWGPQMINEEGREQLRFMGFAV